MSLIDLLTLKTQAAWFSEMRTKLKDVYKVPVESWVSVVNTGLALSMYLSDGLEKVGDQLRGILRALDFETSSGAGLTAFGRSQYQLPRLENSFAVGQVLLSCIGAGPYTLAPGDLTVGTPGSEDTRCGVVTARALSLPPLTCGAAAEMLLKNTCRRPAMRSVISGPTAL